MKKRKIGAVILACLMLFLAVVGDGEWVKAASQDDEWRYYTYRDEHGNECCNKYIYPSKAEDYGISENCFKKEGVYHYKGGLNQWSYCVRTYLGSYEVGEFSEYKKKLDSDFIVWRNEYDPPIIEKVGEPSGMTYAGIKYEYSNIGAAIAPAENCPMVSVRMIDDNPDLFYEYEVAYKLKKTSSKSWAKLGSRILTLGVAVVDSDVVDMITSTVDWATEPVFCSASETGIETTGYGSLSYFDDREKIKSLAADLKNVVLNKKGDYVNLKYREVFPEDALNYTNSDKRRVQIRYSYKICFFEGKKYQYEYTDKYTDTYRINSNVRYLDELLQDGKITASINGGMVYTGKEIEQNPVVKYRGKKLIKGTDYTLQYFNNKEVGVATVRVKGKGAFKSYLDLKFKITLANPSGLSVSVVNPVSATVSWKGVTGASGYEVERRIVGGKTAVTYKISGNVLKYKDTSRVPGQIYQYRVRAYRVVKGKKVYSNYTVSVKK